MAFAIGAMIAAVSVAGGSPVTWHNVSLGAPASTLRASLGDPVRIMVINGERIARYWLPGAKATYMLVMERNGYINGFEAFNEEPVVNIQDNVAPDPSGVHIGDTIEDVRSKHSDFRLYVEDGNPSMVGRISSDIGAAYSFQNGRVHSFFWSSPYAATQQPALAPLSEPAGDSMATALLDMQANETDGTSWEYRYLGFHPCDGQTLWQLKQQSLLNDRGKAYDRLHVVCPSSKAERDFYFDISSYFGKL
ncbi:MAG: hypothetical protein JO311_04480 [Candidatus Eremiobacteraeota bacterium]|nr:hypothetical protein [Candidatus Eremiobacteraeota bacterium]MBV9264010.1 hypothetical protein [Candidatus Eremiobacteraeota bacterium]